MLASSSSRAIELMSSKAAFLPSEPEGLIFGHDRDCRCRTPIEQVIDAQHHRLHVRIVHIESIRHDAGGDNPYTTAARATAARTTATSTPPHQHHRRRDGLARQPPKGRPARCIDTPASRSSRIGAKISVPRVTALPFLNRRRLCTPLDGSFKRRGASKMSLENQRAIARRYGSGCGSSKPSAPVARSRSACASGCSKMALTPSTRSRGAARRSSHALGQSFRVV